MAAKLYILASLHVIDGPYNEEDAEEVLGVFSTRERAVAAFNEYAKSYGGRGHCGDEVIHECELDTLLT